MEHEQVYVSPQGYHMYLRSSRPESFIQGHSDEFEKAVYGPLRIEGAITGYPSARLTAIFERGRPVNINLFDRRLYGSVLISEVSGPANRFRAVFHNTGPIKQLENTESIQ